MLSGVSAQHSWPNEYQSTEEDIAGYRDARCRKPVMIPFAQST